MTINEELKMIARNCITSEEFAKKAKSYIKNSKGISQPLMSDCEFREFYRKESYLKEQEKAWEKYDNTIRHALKQRPDCANIFYEAWVDLTDTWIEKWMHTFRFMSDKEIIEVCAKFLNEQDRFYDSQDYIDMLNKSINAIKIK